MKRQINWIVPVVVAAGLIGYIVIWPWYRDRRDAAIVEAVTADLLEAADEIGRELQNAPANHGIADVERMSQLNKTTRDLVQRMKDVAPKLKGDTAKEFRAAQDRYLNQVTRMGERLNEMKKKINEMKKSKG